jgi:hypothetical protein
MNCKSSRPLGIEIKFQGLSPCFDALVTYKVVLLSAMLSLTWKIPRLPRYEATKEGDRDESATDWTAFRARRNQDPLLPSSFGPRYVA